MKENNIKNLKLKIINFFKKIYYRFFPVWRKEKKRYYLKQKKLTKKYSKYISKNIVFSSTNYQPNLKEYVIELAGIRKFYYDNKTGKKIIFENINLKIKKGEFVVIVGPSGAGKTTIFNIMSGIDKVTYGDVFVKGKNLSFLNDKELTSFRRDNIGLIFQKSLLFNDLTTKDNVKVTWYLLNNENKLIENERIKEVFKDVSMYEHINKYPYQLSGGEQQRISIAMALIKNPDILFCDEPTSALDADMSRKILEILLNLNHQKKKTIILITHNNLLEKIADKVIKVIDNQLFVFDNQKISSLEELFPKVF